MASPPVSPRNLSTQETPPPERKTCGEKTAKAALIVLSVALATLAVLAAFVLLPWVLALGIAAGAGLLFTAGCGRVYYWDSSPSIAIVPRYLPRPHHLVGHRYDRYETKHG